MPSGHLSFFVFFLSRIVTLYKKVRKRGEVKTADQCCY